MSGQDMPSSTDSTRFGSPSDNAERSGPCRGVVSPIKDIWKSWLKRKSYIKSDGGFATQGVLEAGNQCCCMHKITKNTVGDKFTLLSHVLSIDVMLQHHMHPLMRNFGWSRWSTKITVISQALMTQLHFWNPALTSGLVGPVGLPTDSVTNA